MLYARLVDRLRQCLRGPLPGVAAQMRMAPVYRQDAALLDVGGKDCREAAVLVLFHPVGGTAHLALILRPDHHRHHAGQVAFPGGRRDPGETLETTALREAQEEVALPPGDVEVLGTLTPLYIPPSKFCVHPFVATARAPLRLRPSDAEVAALLHVPVEHLLAAETRREAPRPLGGKTVSVPYFDVEGHRVWGATAMMLAEVLALLEAASEPDRG